mmetsp:Transcript_7487/g.13436  ORF Transcript_7487/g.13436 Transcript_7487/m.13436 type:complete len:447 (+) Transcript_7487:58-1398(+)
MLLAEKLQAVQERDHEYDVDHAHLYKSMARFHRRTLAKEGTFYLQTLVSALTPKGNIYRFMGLHAERRRNTADLWQQMEELADLHKDLLGGREVPIEVRADRLRKALSETIVEADAESQQILLEAPVGFGPVDEFLFSRASSYCGIVVPDAPRERREWITNFFMCILVFFIQLFVPTAVLVEKWMDPNNRLKEKNLWGHLNLHELLCLGNDLEGVLHSIVGVLLMGLVIVIILSYIAEQNNNAQKSASVPSDRYYYLAGNLANVYCNLVTVLLLPFLFWTESEATNIALDSLTLLFVQTLDDFAGYACQYMNKTDDDYAMGATWQMAMLSQCPVSLKDITNPNASEVSAIWKVSFVREKLQAVVHPGAVPRECPRRLQRTSVDSSPLLQGSSSPFIYRATRYREEILPRPEGIVIPCLWKMAWYLVALCLFLVPLFWMTTNKSCEK